MPPSPAVPGTTHAPTQTVTRPRSLRLAVRSAVVAAATTAAAVAALLPAAGAAPAAPSPAVSAPAATVAAPVTLAAAAAPVAPTRAPSATAMDLALSKVGAPYRYGAAGPNAFDCSGLVNWAYKNAGVSLPRTSRAMSQVGTPVSKADLRPGDLVFFYRPVSHVAIYIGDGKVVHASTRKAPVKISDLNDRTFNSARRI
ncbi:C40 family peptidase [Pseudonocardia humida]|uniref:C40 family peptidase n=1 Tax=Pseudonocardia humida TaxID=2800819 RepID=UPI00207C312A|nr:C40 family peptidase [Pseudonocardia humida]